MSVTRRAVLGMFAAMTGLTPARVRQPGSPDPVFRSLDFDTSEGQALVHSHSGFQINSPHQKAWISDLTRLGRGHAERFEIHDDPADVVNGQAYRSMMDVFDTNDGGDTVGSVVGYPDVSWAFSCFWPTRSGTPQHATVSPGFSQTSLPDYEMMFELHERNNVNGASRGINDLDQVSLLAIMIRDGQLQFRGCAGTFHWNGSGWVGPPWTTGRAGTSGRNDQVPIPIVKPGGTDPDMVTDAWVDVILNVHFREDRTGVVGVWARQSGQEFTVAPTLAVHGPTHRLAVGADGNTRSTADYDPGTKTTGVYAHCGLYTGSPSWRDTRNGAHVVILDEIRRWGDVTRAKANWG